MSTIKGIFEPFADYVRKQLNLRKSIVKPTTAGNLSLITTEEITKTVEIKSNLPSTPSTDVRKKESITNLQGEAYDDLNDPLEMDTLNLSPSTFKTYTELQDKINPYPFGRHELFYTYTTEKQCTIRMASGVDVRKENGSILDNGYEQNNLTGEGLAKQYILEGGTQFYGGGGREGFPQGKEDPNKGYSYGDSNIRANAQEGFGDVPMPGIIDANISTKSEDGSLREATVNFICWNRRQLEVLELLYMRPGYPILLEWGWVPYIDNEGIVNNNGFSLMADFFKSASSLENINKKIRDQKIKSGGNYDGFVGFCKNFLFKVREDGGYDCTTELIAHGEILESLKAPSKVVQKLQTGTNFLNKKGYNRIKPETETVDSFLYYLKAIQTNLDKAGFKAALTYAGTQYQKDNVQVDARLRRFEITNASDLKYYQDKQCTIIYEGSSREPTWAICQVNDNNTINTDRNNNSAPQYLEDIQFRGGNDSDGPVESYDDLFGEGSELVTFEFSNYLDSEGNVIPIAELNQQYIAYENGFNEIKDLVADVAKLNILGLNVQLNTYDQIPDSFKKRNKKIDKNHYGSFEKDEWGDAIADEHNHSSPDGFESETIRDLEDLGLSHIFEGTILKEFSSEQETVEDSGFRKKIFVRWDLICQIFNRLVIPKYKDGQPITELTYLTKNAATYKPDHAGTFLPYTGNTAKHKRNATRYLPYSMEAGKVLYPYDNLGLTDEFVERARHDGGTIQNIEQLETHEGSSNTNIEMFIDVYGEGATINFHDKSVTFPPILGRSFDRNICLMPHQIEEMKKVEVAVNDDVNEDIMDSRNTRKYKNFTSFKNVKADKNSIGHVYFNIDYLISEYEQLALEEYKTTDSLGEERTKRRLKKEFSIHDWITTIWNGVNDACAGYYDFGLHTEHERPHVARIIDFTMNGSSSDIGDNKIFTFEPQGLESITRESHFQSKLDNDFASVISIAAQSPKNIHSLEAVSFKAFHKGIKNRFTDEENQENVDDQTIKDALDNYLADLEEYENNVKSLLSYIGRMNKSNYESELVGNAGSEYGSYVESPLSPETAKALAKNIIEQRIALSRRYPEKDNDGKIYNGEEGRPYTGQFRYDLSVSGSTTSERNAIIPLTTSLTMDGIGGINPLQIYKIDKDKLPLGYQDPNIIFVVKKETHKITSGQDWTTSIDGYLSFLNDNPATGQNVTLSLRSNEEIEANRLDRQNENWVDWIKGFPWSASFISWCVRAAEIENLDRLGYSQASNGAYFNNYYSAQETRNFYRTAKHTSFFREEVFTEGQKRYQHLDPKTTPLQVGDILLQGRMVENNAGEMVIGGKTVYPGPYDGSSHSDIVISIVDNIATVVGGNVNHDVSTKLYILDADGIITPNGVPGTDEAVRQVYSNGSILRNKRKKKTSGYNVYDHTGLPQVIAKIAKEQLDIWPQGGVETDPEVESQVRMYVQPSTYRGVKISRPGGSNPPKRDPNALEYEVIKYPFNDNYDGNVGDSYIY